MIFVPKQAMAWCGVAGVSLMLASAPAHAVDVFDVDTLAWFKGGSLADWMGPNAGDFLAFHDDFDDGLPPPSSPWTFQTGFPAIYANVNLAPTAVDPVTESNGFLHMDPTQSVPGANAANSPPAYSLGVRLLSNIDESRPELGFNHASPQGVASIFALPEFSVGSAIGLRLSDAFSNRNNMVDLRMGRDANGAFIHWRVQDFINGTSTVISSVPYVVPTGAERLVLAFTKPLEADAEVFAYFGFMNGSGSYVPGGELTQLAGSVHVFDGESFSAIELRAVSAVPEPGSALMWLAGLGLLGPLGRRLRR